MIAADIRKKKEGQTNCVFREERKRSFYIRITKVKVKPINFLNINRLSFYESNVNQPITIGNKGIATATITAMIR